MASTAAMAVLFDRLGAERYAGVCRNDTTATVLAAWQQSRSKGVAATKKALASSPVEPPDLEDFAWGTIFGVWESTARDAVEQALEGALDDGRLDPATRTWRRTARLICGETLDADHPSQVGQSWRSLVLSERASEWVRRRPAEISEIHQRAVTRFLSPPPTPLDEVTAGPLGLLAWLAGACAEGVTLTSSGYLPRALVVEAVERYGWWEWEKPPRSEADVYQVGLVHRGARTLGIVRRRGRNLVTTRAGNTVAGDPASWWSRLVLLGQGDDDYCDAIFEQMALILIDEDTVDVDELRDRVGPVLATQGWATDEGPLGGVEHGRNLYRAINPWQTWGFVEYQSARWVPTPDGPRQSEHATLTVTPAGRAAATLWLHRRITAPAQNSDRYSSLT